jgi:hypothetical protein
VVGGKRGLLGVIGGPLIALCVGFALLLGLRVVFLLVLRRGEEPHRARGPSEEARVVVWPERGADGTNSEDRGPSP